MDDSASFAELSQQMEAAIGRLRAKQSALEHQMAHFEAIEQQVKSQMSSDAPVMIALGEGYFVERPRDDALAFLARRRREMATVVAQFKERVAEAESTRANMTTFSELAQQTPRAEEQMNDEGLPFMDIVEELDDDDNVVSATVNNQRVESGAKEVEAEAETKAGIKAGIKAETKAGNAETKAALANSKADTKAETEKKAEIETKALKSKDNVRDGDDATGGKKEEKKEEREEKRVEKKEVKLVEKDVVEKAEKKETTVDNKNTKKTEKTPLANLKTTKDATTTPPTTSTNTSTNTEKDAETEITTASNPTSNTTTTSTTSTTSTTTPSAPSDPPNDIVLEIVEHLDDDDNVTSSTVTPMDKSTPATEPPHDESASPENANLSTQFHDLLEDMELIAAPVSRENLLDKINQLDIDDSHKRQLTEAYHRQYPDDDDEVLEPAVPEGADDTFDETTQKHREDVLAAIIKDNMDEDGDILPDPAHDRAKNPTIDTSELLELEILADDFNEDEEDWEGDWPFDEDEDDDTTVEEPGSDHAYPSDEDESDDLLYGGRPMLAGNQAATDMLWQQVMARRQQAAAKAPKAIIPKISTESPVSPDLSSVASPVSSLASPSGAPKRKKSVRWAPKLEIKEVENISDDLKRMEYAPKQSLFKQRRGEPRIYEVGEDEDTEPLALAESPLEDSVLEDSVLEHFGEDELEDMAKSCILVPPAMPEVVREEPKPRVSRFKQSREANREEAEKQAEKMEIEKVEKSEAEKNEKTEKTEKNEKTEKMGAEKADKSEAEAEKSVTEKAKPRVSRFKQQRTSGVPLPAPSDPGADRAEPESVSEQPEPARVSAEPETEPQPATGPVADIVDHFDDDMADDLADDDSEPSTTDGHIRETTMDYQALQHDMETMAKAYVLGLYDDDIVTEGPVVEELHDFEVINRMVESMDKQNPPQPVAKPKKRQPDPQFDARSDEVGAFDSDSDPEMDPEMAGDDDDDEPMLASEVVENEVESPDEDAEDTVLESEILANYHRLRQKLIYNENGHKPSQQELERVPIDAEGNPVRVSRFKAARLGKH
ncbi:hypothetical protein DICA1_F02410 [Diutina catenulata]